MSVPENALSSTLAVAFGHRSIRRFKPQAIPPEILQQILEAGLRAPSSGNLQLWSVVVTQDPEIREKLFELHRRQPMIRQAPVVLTFCADLHRTIRWLEFRGAERSFDDLLGFVKGTVDAMIAAQTMALCAESLGLGICYMGSTLYAAPGIAELLEIPNYAIPVTSMVLGYPDESPTRRPRIPLRGVTHREKYEPPSNEDLAAIYRGKEEDFLARIAKNDPSAGLESAARFYTSKEKYSKELHTRASREIMDLLKRSGLWNF